MRPDRDGPADRMAGFREHVNTAYHGLRQIPGRGRTRYRTASTRVGSVWVSGIAAQQSSCK